MTMRNIINALCLLIAACAVGYVIYMNMHPQPVIDNSIKNQILAEAKIISKKIDKDGLEHTIIETTNNMLPFNLKQSEGLYDKAFVDSLIAKTDIQKQEITALTQINQTIRGKNLQAVLVIDSLNRQKFEYNDKNLYLSYTPVPGDSSKAGRFNYSYNQKINIVDYNRKKWLFGQDRYYTDLSTDSPYSTINGVRKLSVMHMNKDFSTKISAKSTYLPEYNTLAVGAAIRLRYKRITLQTSRLYMPDSKDWITPITLEFELLNF